MDMSRMDFVRASRSYSGTEQHQTPPPEGEKKTPETNRNKKQLEQRKKDRKKE
jgi:hypothetical protein